MKFWVGKGKHCLGWNLGPREPTEMWSRAGVPRRSASKADLTLVPRGEAGNPGVLGVRR